MDIQSIKVDLIDWITKLEDRKVLEQIQAHKALLDDRIASYEKDPSKVVDWSDVMKEIESSQ